MTETPEPQSVNIGPGRILVCQCSYARVVAGTVVAEVLRRLREEGVRFDCVDDLCELAAQRDPRLKRMVEGGQGITIAACYPRAVRWLFAMGQAHLPATGVTILNMRVQSGRQVAEALLGQCEGTGDAIGSRTQAGDTENVTSPAGSIGPDTAKINPDGWLPWFPVIDYDRCTHCAQCLSFCLFGVFGVSAQRRIEVQNPVRCKPNCPACARVCPEVAILFPKYKAGPISGDEIKPEELEREKLKVDISALLGGNLHQLLRERNRREPHRFSPGRDADQARRERREWLAKLVGLVDIPPEVLRSLPIPEEMKPSKAGSSGSPDTGSEEPGT
ncbi:MAG: ferredoxin family protein [Candidatus Omnitrophica bacterium]|nr:ferredoxin family protein [Candidatus Omnitrophota bacterium]